MYLRFKIVTDVFQINFNECLAHISKSYGTRLLCKSQLFLMKTIDPDELFLKLHR